MRCLLINQFFWPDAAATSQLLTDLARHLREQGHEVDIICGLSGYSGAEEGVRPDVTIHRVGSVAFSRGKLGRLLSYGSFYALASLKALTVRKPDVVLTLTTPPLLSLLGNLVKLGRGSRHVIWEMDMYPDVAVDLNYFRRGGLLDRVVGAVADMSRRYADAIIALGECMKQRLEGRGVPARKIVIIDNWADSSAIQVSGKREHLDKLVLLYSGNLGLAHDIDTLVGAMRQLRGDPRFLFTFVGSGGRRDELRSMAAAEGVQNIEFKPYVQRADLGQQLAAGDIGLVTQAENCCGSVVPSKVYGLLAAGRPVLFIGPKNATPARIVERFHCGWHIACGDAAGLEALLLHLAAHPEEVAAAGQRARETLVQNFDRPHGTSKIEAVLQGSTVSTALHANATQPPQHKLTLET